MKLLAAGLSAIGALSAASVLGVWWATRPAPAASARGVTSPPRSSPAAVPGPAAPPPSATVPAPSVLPLPTRPSSLPAPARSAGATGSPPGTPWDEIPPVAATRLPALSRALGAARPRLERCFDPEVQAREARRPYTSVGTPAAGPGGAVLLLHLEAAPGGPLRVVDAPVVARGAVDDGLLACAQGALRGLELGGSGAGEATRLRVRYPLAPLVPGVQPGHPAPRVRQRPR